MHLTCARWPVGRAARCSHTQLVGIRARACTKLYATATQGPHVEALLARYAGPVRLGTDVLCGSSGALHRPAAYYEDENLKRVVTYGELRVRSSKLAAYLHSRGVKRGESVAIMLPKVCSIGKQIIQITWHS